MHCRAGYGASNAAATASARLHIAIRSLAYSTVLLYEFIFYHFAILPFTFYCTYLYLIQRLRYGSMIIKHYNDTYDTYDIIRSYELYDINMI